MLHVAFISLKDWLKDYVTSGTGINTANELCRYMPPELTRKMQNFGFSGHKPTALHVSIRV
jgi:hypothetical protein